MLRQAYRAGLREYWTAVPAQLGWNQPFWGLLRQMTSHYAPGASVRLNAEGVVEGEVILGFGAMDCTLNLSPAGDLVEAAANLFGHLHALDAMGPEGIAVAPIPETGLGRAINDRLRRAAAPR